MVGNKNRGGATTSPILVRISDQYSHGYEVLLGDFDNESLVLEITTFCKVLEIIGNGALSCNGCYLLPYLKRNVVLRNTMKILRCMPRKEGENLLLSSPAVTKRMSLEEENGLAARVPWHK